MERTSWSPMKGIAYMRPVKKAVAIMRMKITTPIDQRRRRGRWNEP